MSTQTLIITMALPHRTTATSNTLTTTKLLPTISLITPSPDIKMCQQETSSFQCVFPARDSDTPTNVDVDDEGFYPSQAGDAQRHDGWESLIDKTRWIHCAKWPQPSFPQQCSERFNSPDKPEHQDIIHTRSGLCDICLTGHLGYNPNGKSTVYSSETSKTEAQLTIKSNFHTSTQPTQSQQPHQQQDDEAFEMVDSFGMEDPMPQNTGSTRRMNLPTRSSFSIPRGSTSSKLAGGVGFMGKTFYQMVACKDRSSSSPSTSSDEEPDIY
ncbi:hypothetical protein V8F06_011627 [Rhypophila decipiens]